jgi:hypothetical protein
VVLGPTVQGVAPVTNQAEIDPHSTRQSHGCSPDVVLGHTKHPLDVRGTAAYPHRREFGGRNNVRRPTQIGAYRHPPFIKWDIGITFFGFDFISYNMPIKCVIHCKKLIK